MPLNLAKWGEFGLELGFCLALVVAPFGGIPGLRSLVAVLILFSALLVILDDLRSKVEAGWMRSPLTYLFAAFLLLAVANGPVYFEAAERILLWAAVLLGAVVLTRRQALVSLRILLLIGLLCCIQALAERLYLMEALRNAALETLGTRSDTDLLPFLASERARVTFGQANGLAAFLVLLLPFALGRAFSKGAARIPAIGLSLALLAALWASGSRGGSLAAITAMSLGLSFRTLGRTRLLGRLLLAASLSAWLLVLLVYVTGTRFVSADGPFETLLLRRGYALKALDLTTTRGTGLELFGEAQSLGSGQTFSRYPHQAILGLVVELGLFALPALLALVLLVRRLWRCREEEESISEETPPVFRLGPPFLALVLAAFLGTLGFLVDQALVDALILLALAFLADRFLVRPMLAKGMTATDRWRLAAGALGVLLHAQMDFDLRIFSVSAALCLTVGLALPEESELEERAASWRSPLLVLLILGAVALFEFYPLPNLREIKGDLFHESSTRRDEARRAIKTLPERMKRLPGLAERIAGLKDER